MVHTQLREHAPERFVVDFNMSLIASGFSPAWMKELFPENTEDKFDRIFMMFKRLGFSGKEAATAIREATAAFQTNKEDAEKNGWPLKYPAVLTDDFTKPEAYFIEQLASAVMDMRKQMAKKLAVKGAVQK